MPSDAFTEEQKAEYVRKIDEGSGRLPAAQGLEIDYAIVDAALTADEAFRLRVELSEQTRVHDALIEAATAGNVPAMQIAARQTAPRPDPTSASSGAVADVRRIAKRLRHLLHPEQD